VTGREAAVALEMFGAAELDEVLAGESSRCDDIECEDELVNPVIKVRILVLLARAQVTLAVEGDDVAGVLDGYDGIGVL